MTSSLLQGAELFLEKEDIDSALKQYKTTGKYLNFQRSLKTGLLLFDNLILEQLIGFIISDRSKSSNDYYTQFRTKINLSESGPISNFASQIMYTMESDFSNWRFTYNHIDEVLRNEIKPILATELFREVSKIRKIMYSNSTFEMVKCDLYSKT
jgi:hypothetical protein